MIKISEQDMIQLRKRFCKDCNIPISIFQEPYFSERLILYDKFYGTLEKWDIFMHYLNEYDYVQDYFEDYNLVKDKAISHIKESKGYQEFINEDMNIFAISKRNISSKDIYHPDNDGKMFLSIDMKQANYSSLYHYDKTIFSSSSWEDFLRKYTNNEHIIHSKYIRQVILGNCSPKRQITYEKYLMDGILDFILSFFLNIEDIVFFSNDEIVFYINDNNRKWIVKTAKDLQKILDSKAVVPLKVELFNLHKIGGVNGYYKEIYKEDSKEIKFKCLDSIYLPFILREFLGQSVTENDKIFYYDNLKSKFIETPQVWNINPIGQNNQKKNGFIYGITDPTGKNVESPSFIKLYNLSDYDVIEMPEDVKELITSLQDNGYTAYVVGGCVRDSLLGKEPHDWDICTSATPDKILDVFKTEKVIKTGLQHGTVTVVKNGIPYEITTYRIDGVYSDNRRPDNVLFTDHLLDDLNRRDFTINAMAYNDNSKIVDAFSGIKDMHKHIIRAVGSPECRFKEDALRILRAIRFSSILGFTIELNTKRAMENHSISKNLKNISAERVSDELVKMIHGAYFSKNLIEYIDIISIVIPELYELNNFTQKNPYHIYDVLTHTSKALEFFVDYNNMVVTTDDTILLLAILFHDIGKPHCYQDDEDGTRHFKGHEKVSAEITNEILHRLRFSNEIISKVTQLIYYHDSTFVLGEKYVRRWLNKIGEDQFRRLLLLKKADISAQVKDKLEERIHGIEQIEVCLEEVLSKTDSCFTMKDLLINGNDVMEILQIKSGPEIGIILNDILNKVIDGNIQNDREVLLNYLNHRNGD